ncbi:MAG: hypothetical protein GYB58_18795 [Gammaproteobacteria bacterium]|nr:hypothetical protein [Gammaproteobacteria bacterium]
MSAQYARLLDDYDLSVHFLTNVLGLDNASLVGLRITDVDELAQEIMANEKVVVATRSDSTLSSPRNRNRKYKNEDVRKELRLAILRELIKLDRLDDDDEIKLGNGGAKPRGEIGKSKDAFIITGLPASGKSGIVNFVADEFGAYVVDSDYAKRKLPEFNVSFGANLVHEESQVITFGTEDEKDLNFFDYCVSKEHNIIIPKIGHDHVSLEQLRDKLIAFGYKVHLTLVSLDRCESTKRALYRYISTSRYVPLSLVFDCYANDPILSYYRTKTCEKWSSVGKISSNVARGSMPLLIEASERNPASLFLKG